MDHASFIVTDDVLFTSKHHAPITATDYIVTLYLLIRAVLVIGSLNIHAFFHVPGRPALRRVLVRAAQLHEPPDERVQRVLLRVPLLLRRGQGHRRPRKSNLPLGSNWQCASISNTDGLAINKEHLSRLFHLLILV